MNFPNEPSGDSTFVSWCRKLLRAARASEIKPSPKIRVNRTSNGTFLDVIGLGGASGDGFFPFKIFPDPNANSSTDPAAWRKFYVRSGRVMATEPITGTDSVDNPDSVTVEAMSAIEAKDNCSQFWIWLEYTGSDWVVRYGDDTTADAYPEADPEWSSSNPWTSGPTPDSEHIPLGYIDTTTNPADIRQLVRTDLFFFSSTTGSVVDSQFDGQVFRVCANADQIFCGNMPDVYVGASPYTTYNDFWRPGAVTVLNHNMELDGCAPFFSYEDALTARVQFGGCTGMAVLPSGNIVIAGEFSFVNDTQLSTTSYTPDSNPWSIAIFQPDGQILSCAGYAGSGPDDYIGDIAILSDGQIMVVGNFQNWNGTARKGLCLLNGGLEVVGGFSPGNGPNTGGTINMPDDIARGSDCYYIVGPFATYDATSRPQVAKVSNTGANVAAFDPGTGPSGGSSRLRCVAIDGDGHIYVGGGFTSFNGSTKQGIVKLDGTDGSVLGFDSSVGIAGGDVYCILLQGTTKLIVGGTFTSYDGTSRTNLCRLNTDGTLDTAWTCVTNGKVEDICELANGNIVVCGWFTEIGPSGGTMKSRGYIAQLSSDGTVLGP